MQETYFLVLFIVYETHICKFKYVLVKKNKFPVLVKKALTLKLAVKYFIHKYHISLQFWFVFLL